MVAELSGKVDFTKWNLNSNENHGSRNVHLGWTLPPQLVRPVNWTKYFGHLNGGHLHGQLSQTPAAASGNIPPPMVDENPGLERQKRFPPFKWTFSGGGVEFKFHQSIGGTGPLHLRKDTLPLGFKGCEQGVCCRLKVWTAAWWGLTDGYAGSFSQMGLQSLIYTLGCPISWFFVSHLAEFLGGVLSRPTISNRPRLPWRTGRPAGNSRPKPRWHRQCCRL